MTNPDPALVRTRRLLHGIAECLLAGPQHRASGEIALRITPGGFATTATPDLRLDGGELVADDLRVPATGTFDEVALALSVECGAPRLLYPGGSGTRTSDVIELDLDRAMIIHDWFALNDVALRHLAESQRPVLWPEHFDVAVLLEDHSFGASPGDDAYPEPYAYVSAPENDGSQFFNVSFGALRSADELNTVEELVAFWEQGLDLIRRHAR